jgi:hypothetical protein
MRDITLSTAVRQKTTLKVSLKCALTTEENTMRPFSLFITAIAAVLLFPVELPAQDDKTAVMHAAALFIRDSLPGGPILLDLDGVPSNSAQGDATARSLNATRGSARSAIACTPIDTILKRLSSCFIASKQVLVEIRYPFVLGNKAQTTVKYIYEYMPGKVGFAAWELQLLRDTTGTWRVSQILGMTRS